MVMELKKVDKYRYLISKTGDMRTDGLIYADEKMLSHILSDKSNEQVSNVACLPGIVGKSLAMPDIHWGYGFPIGGVAGFDINTGIISPGGIGYDINCGVRLLRTNLKKEDITKKMSELIYALFSNIPSGVGSTGKLKLTRDEVKQVLEYGAKWAIKRGFGSQQDLKHTEEEGCLEGASSEKISPRAIERGREQLGSLGAGNHFLEIQVVEEIYDSSVANVFGLQSG